MADASTGPTRQPARCTAGSRCAQSDGHGDADTAAGLTAVPRLLLGEVQRPDPLAGVERLRRRAGRAGSARRSRTRGRRGPCRRGSWCCRGRTCPRARRPSASAPAIRSSSSSVSTSQARWYSPTVARPAVEGPAAAPISNSPRSWSLVEPGACRNAAPREPSGAMLIARKPRTSCVEGHAALEVADVEDRVVEAMDAHGVLRSLSLQLRYPQPTCAVNYLEPHVRSTTVPRRPG